MAKLLIYYAHPGHKHSRVNRAMAEVARSHSGVTFCDLYATYPRYNIDIETEQEKLLEHDVILFQHPFFWYSTPSIIKEWIDLVLEHGFAFGAGGDKLAGKYMMNALSTAGPQEAYSPEGYQHYPVRTFLTPLEQTARLCHMQYLAPYVLHSALNAEEDQRLTEHVAGYQVLLDAICQDRYPFADVSQADAVTATSLSQFVQDSP